MSSNNMPPPSHLGSWVLLLASAFGSYGLDSKKIMEDAGIDLDKIKNANTRLPSSALVKMWDLAVQQSGDPYIAIHIAHCFKPTSLSALGMAMAASRNIYDALLRCSRYSSMVSDAHIITLEETENELAYVARPRPELRELTHIYGMTTILCCLYQMLKDIAGEFVQVKEVHFEGQLASRKPFEDFFGCPVFYQADCNKLILSKENVYSEQIFANDKLAGSLDEWIEEYLASSQQELLATRVQKFLLKNLIYGELSQAKVAIGLGMSTRTLQRLLKEERAVYSELFDNCRKKLALKLVSQSEQPLLEVAFMLGFSDQSNFTRAFKRWTGTTPHQY